jgi:RNA polymerase sigma-70 factor (ECF subfamily)
LEEGLVQRVERLDPAAFTDLYRRWQGRVVPYLHRLVGDPATAEDLFQESFLRALEGRARRWTSPSGFSGWLFRVATRLGLDTLRRRRRHPLGPIDPEPAAGAPPRDHELADELRRAVAALPDSLRTVFLLRAQEEQTYAEIARTLGVSEVAVRSRMFYARRRLAAALQPHLEDRP